jgi:hypothetical protein
MMTPDDTMQLVNDCMARESKLTNWERDFIDSLEKQLSAGRGVTEKQYDRLSAIWEKVTG